VKVRQVHQTKSPLAASERGSADGLTAVGLFVTHQTDGIAGAGRGAVPLSAVLSSTSSVHQSISKQGLEEENAGHAPHAGADASCFREGGTLTAQMALVARVGERAAIEACRRSGIVPPAWLTNGGGR
jgi:hypothetical protein